MAIVASTLTAVSVYRRGATVVRRAVVDVAAGAAIDDVEIDGLPLALLDPTVRVRVVEVSPANTTVVAASVRVGLSVRDRGQKPDIPEEKELERLRRAIAEKQELAQLLDAEVELLESIPVPDRPSPEEGRAPPPAPLASRLALESFADDAAGRRRSERRALATAIRDLAEELQRLESRVASASSSHRVHLDELTKSAQIALRSTGERPTRVVLELSYVVPGARWAPAYQVKLARDGTKAEVQLRAHIAQRSGEDWRGVKLRLSTALPLRFTELPEMPSLRIGKAQPPAPKKGFRAPPAGGEVLFRDFDRGRERAALAVPAPRSWARPVLELEDDVVAAPRDDTGLGGAAVRTMSAAPVRDMAKSAKKMSARRSVASAAAVDMDDALFEAASLDDNYDEEEADDRSTMRMESLSAPPPPAPSMRAMAKPAPAPAGGRARGGGVDDVAQAITFPLLRLPGAHDGGRGKLREVDLAASYRDSLARYGRPFGDELLRDVQAVEAAAHECGGNAPPMTVDMADLSSHFDFVYEADGVVDVDGDGVFHSVALGVRECPASVRYVAVPREELAVYRTAVITNPLSAPLLPGPAEVYVGGDYVLTTALPTVAARGELKLGLGVEQAIKIARNARYQETRTGEGVVAMLELVHDVDIDIVNHLGRAIDIEVRERIPVPAQNAEVQVDERSVSPPWETYTQEERDAVIVGGRRWLQSVAAGNTTTLKARYVLKLFSNSEVAGGNRRER